MAATNPQTPRQAFQIALRWLSDETYRQGVSVAVLDRVVREPRVQQCRTAIDTAIRAGDLQQTKAACNQWIRACRTAIHAHNLQQTEVA